MRELNELTKKLLSEGWTKENPPPGYMTWNDYYGGWQYSYRQQQNIIVETPCGLCQIGTRTIDMGYQGIDWCLENDNVTVVCPYRKLGCELNHELLRDVAISGAQIECMAKIAQRQYDYERSIDRVQEMNRQRKEADITAFAKTKARFCREQCRYNEWTRECYIDFDPIICAHRGCSYCSLFAKEFSGKKGNVFYDVKTVMLKEAVGFIPEEQVVHITKGKRLFEKSVRIEICEWIAKHPRAVYDKVRWSQEISTSLFFKKYHGRFFEYEVLNIRAERRESRDLMQDLQDIQNGITIVHQSDLVADAKEVKRKRREKAKNARAEKMLRDIKKSGVASVDKFRLESMIRKGMLLDEQVEAAAAEYCRTQGTVQLSLFEEVQE